MHGLKSLHDAILSGDNRNASKSLQAAGASPFGYKRQFVRIPFATNSSCAGFHSFAQSSGRSPLGAIFTSLGLNSPSTATRSLCAAMTSRMFL
jgi:hypothetical protein